VFRDESLLLLVLGSLFSICLVSSVQGLGLKGLVLGSMVTLSGFEVEGLGVGVSDLVFKIWSSGFRV